MEMKTPLVKLFLLLSFLSIRITNAGNKERNLWTAILTNKIEDIKKHLKDGADPNSKNEVNYMSVCLFVFIFVDA